MPEKGALPGDIQSIAVRQRILTLLLQRHCPRGINGILEEIKRKGAADHEVIDDETRSSINTELLGVFLIFLEDFGDALAAAVFVETALVYFQIVHNALDIVFAFGNEPVAILKQFLVEGPGGVFILKGESDEILGGGNADAFAEGQVLEHEADAVAVFLENAFDGGGRLLTEVAGKIGKSIIEERNGQKYGIIGIAPSDMAERVKLNDSMRDIKIDDFE